MEIEEDFLEIYSFRRVTVFMDCIKPLRRFQNIRVKGGSTVKIHIKYERLLHFASYVAYWTILKRIVLMLRRRRRRRDMGGEWIFVPLLGQASARTKKRSTH